MTDCYICGNNAKVPYMQRKEYPDQRVTHDRFWSIRLQERERAAKLVESWPTEYAYRHELKAIAKRIRSEDDSDDNDLTFADQIRSNE